MAVYFRCPACKGEHRLMMVQTDTKVSFETMRFDNNSEPCPKTGRQVELNRSQLFWKEESGKK